MKKFPWGKVTKQWEIGPYHIVEYEDDRSRAVKYHSWVDGMDTHHSHDTLEGALAFAMAYKHDEYGANSQAAHYFCRMIGVE